MLKKIVLIMDSSCCGKYKKALRKRYNAIVISDVSAAYASKVKDIGAFIVDTSLDFEQANAVLQALKQKDIFNQSPIIIVVQNEEQNINELLAHYGANDYLNKTAVPALIEYRINCIISNNDCCKYAVRDSTHSIIIDFLTTLIEYRNIDDINHIRRMKLYTKTLLKQMYTSGRYSLSLDDICLYTEACTLHDIGKIKVCDDIILKKGRLNPYERQIMLSHSDEGAKLIERLNGIYDDRFVDACYNICKFHHERWDGSGYPYGLSGEKIPLIARVVSIADVYDALTSNRPYKPCQPHKTAVDMITNGDCGLFDPDILDCFKSVKNEFERILKKECNANEF